MLGLFLVVMGGEKHQAFMFIAGQLFMSVAVLCLLYALIYPPDFTQEYIFWLSLVGSLLLGGGVGYGCALYWKVGIFFIGAWLGGLLGGCLYGIIVYLLSDENPTLVLYLTIALSAVITAALCIKYFQYIAMVGSAILGSYFFIRVTNSSYL